MIVLIPGLSNRFNEHRIIIQRVKDNNNDGSILFQDHIYLPNSIRIDANTVYGPCFVVERNPKQSIVVLAKDKVY